MKKLLMTLVFMGSFSLAVYAEHPTAEHPKAEAPAVVMEQTQLTPVDTAIQALIAQGMSEVDAKAAVEDILEQAKDQGLTDDEITAKLNVAGNKQAPAEHPTAEHPTAEHPTADAPKDHPAN